MQVRIHRGAHEIGGSCVELRCEEQRIILDLGLPLAGDTRRPADEALPAIRGLERGDDRGLLGIVISHGHADHYGLVERAHASVPRFVGAATSRSSASRRSSELPAQSSPQMRFLENRTPLELGPFRVTPYLADHSAFDAYQLLVEAKGRRLFYSGDFRGHGRKARLFERLLAEPPPVDTLLLEGTRVSQNEDWGRERLSTEIEVENAACEWFAHTQGLALVSYSAQNVDRLISLYRASRRANRLFVFDLYGATIATATGRTTIPQPGWDGVRTFVPLGQRIRVKRARAFERSTVSVAVVSSPNRSRVMRVDSLSRCAAR